MNSLKRYLGLVWMALAALAGWYLLISQALPKFSSPLPEDRIPALIYAFILTPLIVGGLGLFGWYAWKREYDTE
ncbi:DUF6814 family protein [Flaviaesturariibacter amylovorans]|uniref:DUF3955 domain-containing protein n=1 Tax=Flaviaesturariibacter amylovorans TaxID=1084520 RepID=A0ABP8H128_9BACT